MTSQIDNDVVDGEVPLMIPLMMEVLSRLYLYRKEMEAMMKEL